MSVPETVFRMRHSGLRRSFWLLFSIWFGPSLVVPELVATCPVHQIETGAMSHAHSHAAPARGESPPDHLSHRGCTCPGEGCTSGTPAPSVVTTSLVTTVQFLNHLGSFAETSRVSGASFDLLLPPPTGPPPRA